MIQFNSKGLKEVRVRGNNIILEYEGNKLAYRTYISEYGRAMKIANKYKEVDMKQIGTVSSYFDKAKVAALKLTGDLLVGDKIKVIGSTTDFEQEVTSMEINNKKVKVAKAKDDVGIKVTEKVRKKDKVYIV